jgi:hypothetical protein
MGGAEPSRGQCKQTRYTYCRPLPDQARGGVANTEKRLRSPVEEIMRLLYPAIHRPGKRRRAAQNAGLKPIAAIRPNKSGNIRSGGQDLYFGMKIAWAFLLQRVREHRVA